MLQSCVLLLGDSVAEAAAQSHRRSLLLRTADPCWAHLESSSALPCCFAPSSWPGGMRKGMLNLQAPSFPLRQPKSHPSGGGWGSAGSAGMQQGLGEIATHRYDLCLTPSALPDPAKAARTAGGPPGKWEYHLWRSGERKKGHLVLGSATHQGHTMRPGHESAPAEQGLARLLQETSDYCRFSSRILEVSHSYFSSRTRWLLASENLHGAINSENLTWNVGCCDK